MSTDDGGPTGDDPELDPPPLLSFVVEPTPTYAPVQGAWPSAAFDGTSYLVVWEDFRVRRPILYGGRITADGTVLDPYGFRILDVVPETGELHEYESDVAFDGENFLVVTLAGGRIHGVRVSPAGEVLDPGGFLIPTMASPSRPSLVFDGKRYQMAWSQMGLGWSVYWARVHPNGTVLDPGGVFVHGATSSYEEYARPLVSMSFDGSKTLLSWTSGDLDQPPLVYAARISADGMLLDDPALRLSPEGVGVDQQVAGFDGTNHVIAWSSEDGIRASRVSKKGTILDPDGFIVDQDGEYWGTNQMAMAAGNGHSIVVWSAFYFEDPGPWADPVSVARIAADGTPSVHPNDTFPTGMEPTVAAHPDGALLLWRDAVHRSHDDSPIVGTRLDAATMPVADSEVTPASPASRQDVVAVASDGQNFFVLWKDTRAPTGQGKALYGTRVGADGTPLDSESLQFTTEHVYYDPDVVFDGANFVVNWSDPPQGEGDSDALNTVRVSPAGERLDVEPLHPPLCGNVAGASDGTLTLLVGHKCGYDQNLALLLDQDGAVASELIPIPGVQEPSPVASFDGTHYLVVFSDENQTSGQLITQAGELEGQPFSVLGPSHIHVKIAGGGGNHLLVWEGPLGVEFRRVSSDGQALDAGLVALLENSGTCTHESDLSDCSEPSVAFDGENFVVAWRELSIPAHASSLDLYAAKVSPEGEVSPRFPISQEPEREGAPFVAVNGEGQVLATYNRFVPGPPYDTRRAVATLLP